MSGMQIFVKSIGTSVFVIDIHSGDFIGEVRRRIERVTVLDLQMQDLNHDGELLLEDTTFRANGIHNMANVQLSLRVA